MSSKGRDTPVITGENAKRFIQREQAVNRKRKSYAKKKAGQFEKIKDKLTNEME